MSNVKKEIKRMADTLGYQQAFKLLVIEGVSTRASEMLCKGTYPSEPKSIRDKLESVLRKNGFSTEGKAS